MSEDEGLSVAPILLAAWTLVVMMRDEDLSEVSDIESQGVELE